MAILARRMAGQMRQLADQYAYVTGNGSILWAWRWCLMANLMAVWRREAGWRNNEAINGGEPGISQHGGENGKRESVLAEAQRERASQRRHLKIYSAALCEISVIEMKAWPERRISSA